MRFVISMPNLVFIQRHFEPKFWHRAATMCVLEGKQHAKWSWVSPSHKLYVQRTNG